MENLINLTTTVAIAVVIAAYLITLIDKVRKTKAPLTLEDLTELASMIKKQYDVAVNYTNAEKKADAVESLRKIAGELDGKLAKQVAENPDFAGGLIEKAVQNDKSNN